MSLRKGVGIAACLIGIAGAGCGGGHSTSDATQATTASTVAKHPQHARWRCHNGSGYKRYPRIAAAKLISHPEPIGGGAGMEEIVNEWNAGTHDLVTTVMAGRDFRDPSNGLLEITRERPCYPGYAKKHGDGVRVAGAGPLKITQAPLGRKVVGWAQKRGNLQFTSKNGISGTLHLKNDTVTLDP